MSVCICRVCSVAKIIFVALALVLCVSPDAQAQTEEPTRLATRDLFFSEDMPNDGVVHAHFETDANGEAITADRSRDLGDTFQNLGVRLRCLNENGIVVASGYKFKYSVSRGRSIGNFFVNSVTGKKTSYKGVTRIEFCDPDNPEVAATVSRAGLFVEIVVPGHSMIEAFNDSGHRIAAMISDEDKSSFIGFDSDRPIAWLEVKANEFLSTEKLNEDFAMDDLVFDQPQADASRRFNEAAKVVDYQGNQIKGNDIGAELTSEAMEWFFAPHDTEFDPEKQKGLMVMLDDASVVRCDLTSDGFVLSGLPATKVSNESIVGYWGAKQTAMYPNNTEIGPEKAMLVHPLYCVRVPLPKFDASAQTVSVNVVDADVVSQQNLASLKILPATGSEIGVDFAFLGVLDLDEIKLSELYPIWLQGPPIRTAEKGFVRLLDGQEFIFGGSAGFSLKEITAEGVTVSHGDDTIQISLKDVQTLHRPKE